MAQSQNPNVKVTFSEEDTRKYYEEQKLRMMPLVKFLKKNGLKFKHAACQGARVEYFRMDSLQEILDNKKEQLAQHPTLSPLVQKLNDELYYFKRPENSQKLRFPQTLAPSRTGSGKFAAFKFDTTESKRIYFFAVLIAIVAFVLFPLWPYALKYALWIASVVLLVILVSIILLRLVLYTILASFGVSFWLFPNLFGDYSIMDSLRPLYTIQKWQNDIFSIILRVLSFAIFVYYCHSIYVQPEFYLENFESAKEIVKDVHDWGVDKINGQAGNFSQRALTMDKIINQTADAFQTQKNHYTSFEAPVEQETVDSEAAEEKTDGGQPGQEDYEDQKQKEFVNKPQDQQQQQLQEV